RLALERPKRRTDLVHRRLLQVVNEDEVGKNSKLRHRQGCIVETVCVAANESCNEPDRKQQSRIIRRKYATRSMIEEPARPARSQSALIAQHRQHQTEAGDSYEKGDGRRAEV